MLAQQGEVPPLHEVPAHHADHGRVRSQRRPACLQKPQVPAVERIVFYDYTCGPHEMCIRDRNLILPYAFPRFYRECGREAVFRFSCACLENARDILLALETTFRERYARNLTLSRLSEAVSLPLSPDKGSCMHYDPSLPASVFLQNDLEMLLRMRNVLQS